MTISTVRGPGRPHIGELGTTPGWVSILTVHDETRERRVERMKNDFVATITNHSAHALSPRSGYARTWGPPSR